VDSGRNAVRKRGRVSGSFYDEYKNNGRAGETGPRAMRGGGDVTSVPTSPAGAWELPPDPLAAVPPIVRGPVLGLLAAVDALCAVDPQSLDGPQAAAVAEALHRAGDRLGIAKARLLPVIEADGLWAVGGARSFAQWVAHRHGMSVQAARRQVHLGRTLRDHLPVMARAAAAGEVTLEHAQVLATYAPTSEARREALADPDLPCNETFLVEQARILPVDALRLLARRWAAAADPDADDRGYRAAADREYLELSRVLDGYHLSGQLTIEHGQALDAALRAITPVPAAGHARTGTQRRAQALADLARLGLDHGLVGTGRAVRPQLQVHVDHATLTHLAGAATAGVDEQARPGMPDLTAEDLLAGPQFENGTPVPRVLLDRLACDSELGRIIFGPDSQPLDVGRTERTFTDRKRTAIIARDRHCQYPTCTAPPAISEGHHTRHWARDHGSTDVRTGILMCWYHHDYVHRVGIEIRWRETGGWAFTDRHGETVRE